MDGTSDSEESGLRSYEEAAPTVAIQRSGHRGSDGMLAAVESQRDGRSRSHPGASSDVRTGWSPIASRMASTAAGTDVPRAGTAQVIREECALSAMSALTLAGGSLPGRHPTADMGWRPESHARYHLLCFF